MAELQDTTTRPSSLGDMYALVMRRKWVVLVVALLFGGLGYFYTATSTPKWKARMTLLFPMSDGTSTLLRLTGTNPSAPMLMAAGVIDSQPALESVSKDTGFTIPYLTDILSTSTEPDTNKLIISATNKDKAKALAVVSAAYKALNQISRNVGFSVATRQARELEKAVNEKRKLLEDSAERLRLFQETAKTVSDPTSMYSAATYLVKAKELEVQLKGVQKQIAIARESATKIARSPNTMSAAQPKIGEWRKTLRDMEYTLGLLRIKFGEGAPAVKEQKERISVTRKQLQNEISSYLVTVDENTDDQLAQLTAQELLLSFQLDMAKEFARVAPREALDLQKLTFEFEKNKDTLKAIATQYEEAKVQAEVERVRWGVLEEPFIEPEPTNKKFVRNTGAAFMIGGVLAALALLQVEAKRQKKRS